MQTETVIMPETQTATYKTTTYRIPNAVSYVTFRLDGWDLSRVLQCRLRVDGVTIDTDVPTEPALQFINGKKLRLFALPRMTVQVDVVADVDCAVGGLRVVSEPYPGRYDLKSGVVYRDQFTDIDHNSRTLVYQSGRVSVA